MSFRRNRSRWSKIKKEYLRFLAPSVAKRIDIYATRYNKCSCCCMGREWITFDKNEVFDIIEHDAWTPDDIHQRKAWKSSDCDNLGNNIVTYTKLSIEEIINSDNPVIKALGFLDKRYGKRRLKSIDLDQLHPLEKLMYKIRVNCEDDRELDISSDISANARICKSPLKVMACPKDEVQKRLQDRKSSGNLVKLIQLVKEEEKYQDTKNFTIKKNWKIVEQYLQKHDIDDEAIDFINSVASKSKILDDPKYFEGIVSLLQHKSSFVRDICDWAPSQYNVHKQFASLVRHLFANYPIPDFFDSAFLSGTEVHQNWAIHIGAGGNFRKSDNLPIAVSKKIAHYFLQAPATCSVAEALRYAQVLANGGDLRVAEGLFDTRLARQFVDDKFWLTVIRFFIRNPMLDPLKYNEIVDYIWVQRYQERDQLQPEETVDNSSIIQPKFSMKGRTAIALLRDVQVWHNELSRNKKYRRLYWDKSEYKDFEHIEGVDSTENANQRIWKIEELLSSDELWLEGKTLKHCVLSYAYSCYKRNKSIWSLSLMEDPKIGFTKQVTIELSLQDHEISQIRGAKNRSPRDDEMRIIRLWAMKEEISFSYAYGI